MAAIIFQTLKADGTIKRYDSSTMTPDFVGINIGADLLPLLQGGTGAGAYFDFGTRSLRSSFVPANVADLTNKSYVDTGLGLKLSLTGGTMSGVIAMGSNKITGLTDGAAASQDAATVSQMEAADLLKLSLTGGTMSGAIAMGSNKITGLTNGTSGSQDAATVKQVEDLLVAQDLSAYFKKDGSVTATGDFNMGGLYKITALLDPTLGQDAATKAYVDAVALGLAPKKAARVASTANIAVASGLVNGAVVDGITLVTGDRVLLKDQTLPEENGIYIVAASGAASRSVDMDSLTPIDEVNGAWVPVQFGTANAGRIFVQYGAVNTLGTDAVNFEFYNPLAALVGGDMITNSGSTFSIDLASDAGLESTNPGNIGGQLRAKLDGATLTRGVSGLKVSTGGIADNEIAAGAAIAHSKMAALAFNRATVTDASGFVVASAVTDTEIGYLTGLSSNAQSQIDGYKNLTNSGGSTINANEVVYIKADGSIAKPTKATAGLSDFSLGYAVASIPDTTSGNVQASHGKFLTGSGFTPGKEYFISGTAGAFDLYANISWIAGDFVYSIGRAISSTQIAFDPKYSFEY